MPQVEVSEEAFEAIEAMRTVGDGVVSPVMVEFSVGDDCKIVGQINSQFRMDAVDKPNMQAVAKFMEPGLVKPS